MKTYHLYARKSSESEDRQIQSIDDQISRLKKLAVELNIQIKTIYTESKSAKKPNNRPQFDAMVHSIEKGEAEGILCWQINRLSRNPIDSARIQWMLQERNIQSIQTIDREYLPDDNTLLFSVESSIANQYIKELSKNVLRGMISKCEKGQKPSIPPPGYMNELGGLKGNKKIIPDPERFDLVRKMWDFLISGKYNPSEILKIANDEWKFRTIKRKKSGGNPLNRSVLYNLFSNPFYYGYFEYAGIIYKGTYPPMISKSEFDIAQKYLHRKSNSKLQKHLFDFTNLIQCGVCGCSITADGNKKKLIKSTGEYKYYEYYYCTKRKGTCSERAVEKSMIESQMISFLKNLEISDRFLEWALKYLKEFHHQEDIHSKLILTNLDKEYEKKKENLNKLIDLKLDGLISNEDFLFKRERIQLELIELETQIQKGKQVNEHWTKSTEKTLIFCKKVIDLFIQGTREDKRLILQTVCSNLLLKDRQLTIEPKISFLAIKKCNESERSILAEFEPKKNEELSPKTTKRMMERLEKEIWLPE